MTCCDSHRIDIKICNVQEKDGKGKSKGKKEEKGDLKPVKEVPIEENEEGTKNESGCVLS